MALTNTCQILSEQTISTKFNLPAFLEPNGHTHKHSLTNDAMQVDYLSLFLTESFYETNFLVIFVRIFLFLLYGI